MNELIAVVGPTAVGKTAISFSLAERFHTELISGDAYQIYRKMNIGTAKPSTAELARYRHHLINIAEPDESYSVAAFQEMATAVIADLHECGMIPVIVGGTGLYVQSLLEGYAFAAKKVEPPERQAAKRRIAASSADELKKYIHGATGWEPSDWHELLANSQRLIRLVAAIEGGDGKEAVQPRKRGSLVYDAFVIGLSLPRPVLYERIERRIDDMIAAGWAEEVKGLLADGIKLDAQAMKAIGYGEMAAYIQGNLSLDEAAAQIKTRTRHFAKRQLTWYRRMPYIRWYEKEKYASEKELVETVVTDIETWSQCLKRKGV